ncbi:MAG: hypothetical protein U9P14_11095 [Gemmatimonadota bacterium]|nr:hypothetical protein [Gemmatimonadota bacterium]
MLDTAYRTRYLRGDTQIIGQEALALQINDDIEPEGGVLSRASMALHLPVGSSRCGCTINIVSWRKNG